jgi:hypothetical protein
MTVIMVMNISLTTNIKVQHLPSILIVIQPVNVLLWNKNAHQPHSQKIKMDPLQYSSSSLQSAPIHSLFNQNLKGDV